MTRHVISVCPLTFSSILGTYRPGEFLFQYSIILPFHTTSKHNSWVVPCRSLAEWSYTMPEVMSRDRECKAVTVQERQRGVYPTTEIGAAAQRSYHTSEVSGGS